MKSSKPKQVSIIENFKYPHIFRAQRFVYCVLSSPVTIIYVNDLIYCFYLNCNSNDFYNFSKVEGWDFLKMMRVNRNM
jgi:hypothetical protein